MIIPIYQAEISHRRIRGKITSLQQLFNALGQIFATWIGFGCYSAYNGTLDSREWRIPLAIQIIPALFLGSLVYMFPESPRWLCDHDKPDQGIRNLARLHSHGDLQDPYVIAEFNLIQNQIAEEHAQKSKTYLDLFRDWPNLRRTILVMMIQASCQMTGVSAIQYFSPQIFAQIGIPTGTTLLLQAVNAIIAFLGTSVCILVIDGIGRRPLEIYGAITMSITFIVNAALIKSYPADSTNTGAHWAFIVMTWVFNFVFFITSGNPSPKPKPKPDANPVRSTFLGNTSRALRDSNAYKGCFLGRHDILRFQYHDRTSHTYRYISYWLAILHHFHCMQSDKCFVLLGFPARDKRTEPGRYG